MKVPFTLGTVGHFGLAVTSPKRSAKWFERALGLSVEFEYEDGIAVGNKNVTIALFKGKPSPETIGHMSFHLPGMTILRKALEHLKRTGVEVEDPGDEIGPEGPGSPNMAFGSMILMVTVGSSRSSAAHGKSSAVKVSPESSEILLKGSPHYGVLPKQLRLRVARPQRVFAKLGVETRAGAANVVL